MRLAECAAELGQLIDRTKAMTDQLNETLRRIKSGQALAEVSREGAREARRRPRKRRR